MVIWQNTTSKNKQAQLFLIVGVLLTLLSFLEYEDYQIQRQRQRVVQTELVSSPNQSTKQIELFGKTSTSFFVFKNLLYTSTNNSSVAILNYTLAVKTSFDHLTNKELSFIKPIVFFAFSRTPHRLDEEDINLHQG